MAAGELNSITPLLTLGVILVVGYLAYVYVVKPAETAGAALASAGSAVEGAVTGAANDIGNPLSPATSGGFFGWLYGVGESLNPLTSAQEAAQQAALAKNNATTSAENAAVSSISQTTTYSSTAPVVTVNQPTSANSGSYNELMVEVNAYDPDVSAFITLGAFSAMIQAGLSSSQINSYCNILQDYESQWKSAATGWATTAASEEACLVSHGVPATQAAAFANSVTWVS